MDDSAAVDASSGQSDEVAQWLEIVKQQVKEMKGGELQESQWTNFFQLVAAKIHEEEPNENVHSTAQCIVGLANRGFSSLTSLQRALRLTDALKFAELLEREGVTTSLAFLLFEKYGGMNDAAAAAAAAAAATVNHHVNVAKGVFLLYRGDDSNAEPIGTAFVISKDLLLTACHNVVVQEQGESFSVVTELKVSPRLIKSETGSISTRGDQRGVSVHVYRYNTQVDWACLRRDESSDPFPFIIPVASVESDIPEEATTDSLFIYHCPIQPFFDDITMEVCHVMVKSAAVGIVGTKTIGFQNGAFPGSCGGPYMYRNKAIALHVDSVSTTKTADDFKNETSFSKAGKKAEAEV